MTNPMKPSEVLRAARELISVPERWTQLNFASDSDGNMVGSLLPQAVRWSWYGAITKSSPTNWAARRSAVEYLIAAVGRPDISEFNAHADLLTIQAKFDRAIALAEQSEAVSS